MSGDAFRQRINWLEGQNEKDLSRESDEINAEPEPELLVADEDVNAAGASDLEKLEKPQHGEQ